MRKPFVTFALFESSKETVWRRSNCVATAYDAFPDRLYIVGADAKVVYQGDRGPQGFDVSEMQAALVEHLEGD